MRVAGEDASALIERITTVQRAFGGPPEAVMLDAVQGWTAERAIALGRRFESLGLGWLEDPVPYEDVDGLARVAAALETPIAAGENAFGPREVRQLVENRATDILILDPQRLGGITGARKAMALAEAWQRPVAFHVFPEVCVQLLAACPTGTYLEFAPLWSDLLADIEPGPDGCVGLPPGPGVPMCLKPGALERFGTS
jgi:L-alanine-DL-glutamate epimerase-like enolase superfamily enzyme